MATPVLSSSTNVATSAITASLETPEMLVTTSVVTLTPIAASSEMVTLSVIVATVPLTLSVKSSIVPILVTESSTFSTRQSTSALSTSRAPLVTASTTLSSNPGLNTGAKAGIAIGAILGALFLAVAAFLLGKHFSHKERRMNTHGDGLYGSKPELDGRPLSKRWKKSVRGRMHNDIHELPALEVRAELDGGPLGREGEVERLDGTDAEVRERSVNPSRQETGV